MGASEQEASEQGASEQSRERDDSRRRLSLVVFSGPAVTREAKATWKRYKWDRCHTEDGEDKNDSTMPAAGIISSQKNEQNSVFGHQRWNSQGLI